MFHGEEADAHDPSAEGAGEGRVQDHRIPLCREAVPVD